MTNKLRIVQPWIKPQQRGREGPFITCLPKESVFAVELIRSAKGEEELAAIIVRASIGHCHQTTAHKLEPWVELILKKKITLPEKFQWVLRLFPYASEKHCNWQKVGCVHAVTLYLLCKRWSLQSHSHAPVTCSMEAWGMGVWEWDYGTLLNTCRLEVGGGHQVIPT